MVFDRHRNRDTRRAQTGCGPRNVEHEAVLRAQERVNGNAERGEDQAWRRIGCATSDVRAGVRQPRQLSTMAEEIARVDEKARLAHSGVGGRPAKAVEVLGIGATAYERMRAIHACYRKLSVARLKELEGQWAVAKIPRGYILVRAENS